MPVSVADAFTEQLLADPGAPVAWTATGMVTRAVLDQAARTVQERLLGVPCGRRIALCIGDGTTFLAAFLALARRGDAAILMDAADPRAPRRTLAQKLGACHVLVDTPELALLPCGGTAVAGVDRAIKLSSGSTGEPSAIAVGDAELLADASALEQAMGIGARDRVLAAVPMSFSYGVGNLLVPALAHGRCLVLPSPGPLGLLRAMRVGEPTVLPAVPALLRALLQGSFALPRSMRQRFQQPVHSFYGSTESGGVCYDRVGDAAERGTVGTPLPGVLVSIESMGAGEQDAGSHAQLEPSSGRVCIRSPAVGRVLDVSSSDCDCNPAAGCFLAPDIGSLVAGELVLHGRAGAVFDVGGHKVDPHEVERLIRELPQVTDACVLPWRDQHGRAVCAAIVAASELVVEDVRRHCARVLPAAKVPRCVAIVAQLPRCSRGKLAHAALRGLLHACCHDGAEAGPRA